ncbi:MAG: hypothetical protein ACK5HL_02350 [Bacilli bacterium]
MKLNIILFIINLIIINLCSIYFDNIIYLSLLITPSIICYKYYTSDKQFIVINSILGLIIDIVILTRFPLYTIVFLLNSYFIIYLFKKHFNIFIIIILNLLSILSFLYTLLFLFNFNNNFSLFLISLIISIFFNLFICFIYRKIFDKYKVSNK